MIVSESSVTRLAKRVNVRKLLTAILILAQKRPFVVVLVGRDGRKAGPFSADHGVRLVTEQDPMLSHSLQ